MRGGCLPPVTSLGFFSSAPRLLPEQAGFVFRSRQRHFSMLYGRDRPDEAGGERVCLAQLQQVLPQRRPLLIQLPKKLLCDNSKLSS